MSTIALSAPITRPSVIGQLRLALRVWRERQALNRLDVAALADLGLSRAEASAEARKGMAELPMDRL
jgi:uncharacterized protein YjiS (DUF1127 family)